MFPISRTTPTSPLQRTASCLLWIGYKPLIYCPQTPSTYSQKPDAQDLPREQIVILFYKDTSLILQLSLVAYQPLASTQGSAGVLDLNSQKTLHNDE